MAVLSKTDLLASLKVVLKDNTSDEAIKLLEDASDTITDFEEKTKDETNWKEKYEQNDAEWRTKYTNRFYAKKDEKDDDEPEPPIDDKPKKLEFSDLFKEVK